VNTPSHAVLNLVLLGRKGRPEGNAWIAAGAVAPDLPILVFAVVARWVLGAPWRRVWGEMYFSNVTQTLLVPFHAVPVLAAAWAVARWRKSMRGELFFASMLLHSALDFPVHHDDAHRHLWPLSDWRFESPISYWDTAYHAATVSLVEVALVVCGVVYLLRAGIVRSRAGRGALVTIALLAVAAQVAFRLMPMG
jgi:hypothetical protein